MWPSTQVSAGPSLRTSSLDDRRAMISVVPEASLVGVHQICHTKQIYGVQTVQGDAGCSSGFSHELGLGDRPGEFGRFRQN
jgi:hypothetical protein